MLHQKISNLLNEVSDSKFLTRKCYIANDQENANYDLRNEVIYSTKVLKSNLCHYNDAYILVRGDITATAAPATQVSFTFCAPFTKCITKIDGTSISYNLIEYSLNYSWKTGRLWCYSKDESTNFKADISNTNNFESFEYKTKLLENTVAQPSLNQANAVLKMQ